MNQDEIRALAEANAAEAHRVLDESGIAEAWRAAGCRVNLVGSMRMGLMAAHRDIDLHVYSSGVTEANSFAVAAKIAADPAVTEIKCINGLHTDEHCVAWHFMYKADSGEVWQIDVIHIEEGSRYDGYFELMADRIMAVVSPQQRDMILKLKFESQAECGFHGVEYYEAVIADSVSSVEELKRWVVAHREKPPYYWIP